MKEKNFSEIEQERVRCRNQFRGLENTFKSISEFLDLPVRDNSGLSFCLASSAPNVHGPKELLKQSLMSITSLKEPSSARVKWTVFKFDTIKYIGGISRTMNGSINADNLAEVVKYVKAIRKKVHNFSENMVFEGCLDTNIKNKIEVFLEYVIGVLKLEEQQRIDRQSVYDADIDTDWKGVYQIDPRLQKQIDAIFGVRWEPNAADITQGQLGDCGLLSALLSIIKTDKSAIRKCFFGQTRSTIKLRFFKVKISIKPKKGQKPAGYKASANGKVIIEIQKSLLKDSSNQIVGNSKNAFWVNIFEKAFTVYKATNRYVAGEDPDCRANIIDKWENKSSPTISVSNLENGFGFVFMTAITGKCSTSRNIPFPNTAVDKKFPNPKRGASPADPNRRNYSDYANNLYSYFDSVLGKGKAVLVCSRGQTFPSGSTRSIWVNKSGVLKNHPGLMKLHSYAMVDNVKIDNDGYKYIVLQNPHMGDDVDYKITAMKRIPANAYRKVKIGREADPTVKNGKLVMELNDFIKYFVSYEVCNKNKK